MVANIKDAVRAAEQVIRQAGLAYPPIDPEKIAEDLGVRVLYADFGVHSDTVSGFIDFSEAESIRIFVNRGIHPNRKTFTIAHELGHFVMHKDWARGAEYVMLRANEYAPGTKPDKETEADVFAANLLVPESMLREYMDLASPRKLAEIFVVSEQVIANRLKLIGRAYA